MELADHLHEFGCWTEAYKIELWGQVHDVLWAPKVHQLVS